MRDFMDKAEEQAKQHPKQVASREVVYDLPVMGVLRR